MRKRLRKKLVNQVITGNPTSVHYRNPVLGYHTKYRYYGYTINSDGSLITGTCPMNNGKKMLYSIGD